MTEPQNYGRTECYYYQSLLLRWLREKWLINNNNNSNTCNNISSNGSGCSGGSNDSSIGRGGGNSSSSNNVNNRRRNRLLLLFYRNMYIVYILIRICNFLSNLQLVIRFIKLTFTTLLAISADDKLLIFSYFSKKTRFDILCKMKTICMKCQNLFSGKN